MCLLEKLKATNKSVMIVVDILSFERFTFTLAFKLMIAEMECNIFLKIVLLAEMGQYTPYTNFLMPV